LRDRRCQRAARAAYDTIAFAISSWGRPIDSWEVRADGTARHVKRVSEAGADFRTYRLEHREFTVVPADFRRLAAIAAQLPQPRLARDECKELATDMPYGTLSLSRGGQTEEVRFDVGCLDAPYQAFVGRLRAMDELVTALAEQRAATRVEQVGGP
jgi:hypothetical protein